MLKTYFPTLFEYYYLKTKSIEISLYYTISKIHSYIIKYKITTSGSTCNIIVINKQKNKFYVANLGDSRAVISYKNNKIKQITQDHKPNNLNELKQISKKGGYVINNRVNGILAMSRSIGDYKLSKYLSSAPDIYVGDINNNFDFIIQSSDGLFDVLKNNELCSMIKCDMKKNNMKKEDILKKIVNYALCYRNCFDNMSIILITK